MAASWAAPFCVGHRELGALWSSDSSKAASTGFLAILSPQVCITNQSLPQSITNTENRPLRHVMGFATTPQHTPVLRSPARRSLACPGLRAYPHSAIPLRRASEAFQLEGACHPVSDRRGRLTGLAAAESTSDKIHPSWFRRRGIGFRKKNLYLKARESRPPNGDVLASWSGSPRVRAL
jgi:hypothetical protein